MLAKMSSTYDGSSTSRMPLVLPLCQMACLMKAFMSSSIGVIDIRSMTEDYGDPLGIETLDLPFLLILPSHSTSNPAP